MKPKITILLATHNRAHLIGETLDSILAQTYENWECIIVDDYSVDDTREVIKSYLNEDSRFSYYFKAKEYKKGLSGTRNQGMDIARQREAEFIQFFDDDDIMHPQKLELKIIPFFEDDTLDLTICCYRKFEKKGTIEFDLEKADDYSCNIITNNLLRSFFLNQINLNSPGPLWRAAIPLKYRFNENLFYAEEREFYLKIFLNEKLSHEAVNKILFWYRKHSKAITSNLYIDQSLKKKSIELFNDSLLNEVLKLQDPPLFILKAYVAGGINLEKEKYLKKIKCYFRSSYRWFDVKSFFLLLYFVFKSYEKKKNFNNRADR